MCLFKYTSSSIICCNFRSYIVQMYCRKFAVPSSKTFSYGSTLQSRIPQDILQAENPFVMKEPGFYVFGVKSYSLLVRLSCT